MKYNFSDSLIRVILVLCFLRFFGMESYVCILFFSTIFNAALSLHRLLKVTSVQLSLVRHVLLPLLWALFSVSVGKLLLRGAAFPSLFFQIGVETLVCGAVFAIGYYQLCKWNDSPRKAQKEAPSIKKALLPRCKI